jgi:hypothetical protein
MPATTRVQTNRKERQGAKILNNFAFAILAFFAVKKLLVGLEVEAQRVASFARQALSAVDALLGIL